MAAVHNNNSDHHDNSNSSNSGHHHQQQQQRNGTTSPGGWHFPKSGLGTPDLFYSFSGGSSSGNNNNNLGPMSAGASSGGNLQQQQQSQQQPAWFKPQGVASTSNNKSTIASSSSTTSAAVKTEEPDDGNDDDGDLTTAGRRAGSSTITGNQQPSKLNKDNTGNEEANRNVRALSDPPVRQSPAWIFPAAGFGPNKTHLEQEPNPFEHSFSSRPEDNAHMQFAQAINAGNQQHHNANVANSGNQHTGSIAASTGGYNNGYPSNAYFNNGSIAGNNQYEIGPPRRARSQSPKSAGWQHSGLAAQQRNNHFNSAYQDSSSSSYLGNNLFGGNSAAGGSTGGSNKGAFGNLSTPSSELPSFGWAFDNASSSSSHAAAAGAAGGARSVAGPNSGIFDPTSIRTGLTPGVSDGGKQHQQPPHSPATQALFAMMTNATPGGDIGAHFNNTTASSKTQQPHSNLSVPSQPHPPTLSALHSQQSGLGGEGSSNNSSSSSTQQIQHGNNPQQAVYSQAIPRPMQPQGPYNSGQAQQQQHLHNSYQGGNPSYLQQNIPRPFPSRAFDSTQSSEASSSQSVPQINTQTQRVGGGGEHNPLFLLSQHAQDGQTLPPSHLSHPPHSIPPNAVQRLQHPHQQGAHSRHPSDSQQGNPSASHNEDAMLAAAALSGLSTPRPAYVGGPSPLVTVNPGTINTSQPVPNLVQPPVGRNKPIPPPASLFHEQKPPSALTKENMKANNARGSSAAAASNKKGGAGNKRKKGATATPEPSNAGADEGSKSKVRRTSRRNAGSSTSASQQARQQQGQHQSLAPEPDSGGEDEVESRYLPGGNDAAGMGLDGGMNDSDDDDMDMMSNNGSLNGSRDGMGGSQAGDGSGVSPPRKGGRGPKQHFATEEEKRKNFLERNRQAALKCRQRKKQWLTQLQSKVEYLTADNETLHATVSRLREEAAKLRAILGVHSDCQLNVSSGPTGPGGVTTVGAYLHGVQQQQGPPHTQQHSQRQY